MAMSIEKLTPKDYELLSYINKFDNVSRAQIKKHLKSKIETIDFRLTQLCTASYNGFSFIKDSSYIVEEYEHITDPQTHITEAISKDVFHITPLGKKALQDYKCKVKSDKRDFLFKSILVPIVVAATTALLIDVLKWLLPLILQLLQDTH